jgi:hypothetical protein
VQAELVGAEISRPETWWDLFVVALASPTLGWITLVSAWAVVPLVWLRSRLGGSGQARDRRGVATLLAVVLAGIALVGGGLHALGLDAASDSPEAIALDELVEVREGPGLHVPIAFQLQGGSHVRVLEQRSGWTRVRLAGGLEGWAPNAAIARLDEGVRTSDRGD